MPRETPEANLVKKTQKEQKRASWPVDSGFCTQKSSTTSGSIDLTRRKEFQSEMFFFNLCTELKYLRMKSPQRVKQVSHQGSRKAAATPTPAAKETMQVTIRLLFKHTTRIMKGTTDWKEQKHIRPLMHTKSAVLQRFTSHQSHFPTTHRESLNSCQSYRLLMTQKWCVDVSAGLTKVPA